MLKNFNILTLSFISAGSYELNVEESPLTLGLHSKDFTEIFQLNMAVFNKQKIVDAVDDLMLRFFKFLVIRSTLHNLIYVYNLSKSGIFLLKFLKTNKKDSDFQLIIKDNLIYRISFWLKNKFYVFLDLKQILPFDFEKACESFDVAFEKRVAFEAYSLHDFIKNDEIKNKFYVAANAEVTALFKLILNYESFLLKTFQLSILNETTLYGYNLKLFLKKYYIHNFVSLGAAEDLFIRQAFLGGVCEVYKPFANNLVWLDFISMYPSIMRDIRLGLNKPLWINKIEDLEKFCDKYPCFIKIKVWCSPALKFPLIGIKKESPNMFIQACGQFETVVWGSEVLYCLRNYKEFYKFEVVNALFFTETSSTIFYNYVSDLFGLRNHYRSSNSFLKASLMKLLLNSLYGRLATSIKKTETKVLDSDEELLLSYKNPNIVYKSVIPLDSDLLILNFSDDKEFKKLVSRVDWACAIASEARIKMQYFHNILDIYYVDVDSFVIKSSDLKLINDEIIYNQDFLILGKLRIVHYCSFGLFIAPKNFIIGLIKAKSFKINTIQSTYLHVYRWIDLFMHKIKIIDFPIVDSVFIELIIKSSQVQPLYYNKSRVKVFNSKGTWVDTVAVVF